MATAEEIRKKLQTQSEQRINPLLKGLSMLTGGVAGEFTGTNEQIRQQRSAKRTLMAEEAAALSQQRIEEAARLAKEEDLKRQVRAKAAEDEARLLEETRKSRGAEMALKGEDMVGPLDPATMAGMAAAKAAQARVEAEQLNAARGRQQEDRGYLSARNIQLGEPDPETVAFLAARERTKEAAQKEAERKMSGYLQFNIPGVGTIGGNPEQIKAYKNDPFIGPMLSKLGTDESVFTSSVGFDMETSTPTIRLGFKSDVTPEKQAEITGRFAKAFAGQTEFAPQTMGATTAPKTLPKGPAAKEGSPTVGRGSGAIPTPAASIDGEMQFGGFPTLGETKPDIRGVYYTGTKDGSTSGITQTGAYDIPEYVTSEMSRYPMSTEARMNILKNYIRSIKPEVPFGTKEVKFPR